MLFVRIGNRWLNVAHVSDVVDENPDLIKVKMTGALAAPLSFRGDDAQAIREFFSSRPGYEIEVIDITPEVSMEDATR